jgi:hypothetical protein
VDVRGDAFSLLATVALNHNLSGGLANGCAFSRDGTLAHVGAGRNSEEGPTLFEIALTAPYRINQSLTFPAGDHLDGVARAGDVLYAAAMEEEKIHVVDVLTFTAAGAIDLPGVPTNCALHPDHRHLSFPGCLGR